MTWAPVRYNCSEPNNSQDSFGSFDANNFQSFLIQSGTELLTCRWKNLFSMYMFPAPLNQIPTESMDLTKLGNGSYTLCFLKIQLGAGDRPRVHL